MVKTLNTVKEGFYEQHKMRHEEAQTKLLEEYTDYQVMALKQKIRFKRCFFVVSLMMMFFPPVFLVALYRSIYFGYISQDSLTAIGSAVGGVGALVADIMFLPKTVASYCFNKDEDSNILKLFSNAQNNDKHHDDRLGEYKTLINKLTN